MCKVGKWKKRFDGYASLQKLCYIKMIVNCDETIFLAVSAQCAQKTPNFSQFIDVRCTEKTFVFFSSEMLQILHPVDKIFDVFGSIVVCSAHEKRRISLNSLTFDALKKHLFSFLQRCFKSCIQWIKSLMFLDLLYSSSYLSNTIAIY